MTLKRHGVYLTAAALLVAMTLTFGTSGGAAGRTPEYFSIDVPDGTRTAARAIGSKGEIVGDFTALDGSRDGFVLERGEFTAFDIDGNPTRGRRSNARGQVVGDFRDANQMTHGYVADDKAVTQIDVPFAGVTFSRVLGINPQGDIVGDYIDASGRHGFLSSEGVFTTIDPPGSLTRTLAFDINARGDIVGITTLIGIGQRGFLLIDGVYTFIDGPGPGGTTARGINAQGDIVGTSGGIGYLLSDGEFTTIAFPDALGTTPRGINERGEIAGFYLDADEVVHGFVRR